MKTLIALLTVAPVLAAQLEIDGAAPGDALGTSLANVGDLDGDGTTDLAIGAPSAGVAGSESGTLRVVSGATGDVLFERHGFGALDEYASEVAGVDDVDGDGVPDVLTGAPQWWSGDGAFAGGRGYATLLSGADGGVLLVSQGDTFELADVSGFFGGGALCATRDVDGDGAPDILVGEHRGIFDGTPLVSAGLGRVQVRSSADGRVLVELRGEPTPTPSPRFGRAAADARDLTGDGVRDVVITSSFFGQSARGRVELRDGVTFETVWASLGESFFSQLGRRVVVAPDVDGDGIDDVLANSRAGARVLSGADGAELYTVFTADYPTDDGPGIAGLGDVDGDGFGDFAVGDALADAPLTDDTVGVVTIYSGQFGAPIARLVGEQVGARFGATLAPVEGADGPSLAIAAPGYDGPAGVDAGRVTVVDISDGFFGVALVLGQASEGVGRAVAIAGDVDNDGWADVVAGLPFDDTAGTDAGRVVVFSGRDGSVLLDRTGQPNGERLGSSVARVGDVDQDGFADVAAAAPFASGPPAPGRVVVWSGRDGSLLLEVFGVSDSDHFGDGLAGGGDADGDGVPDLVIGAPLDDLAGLSAGAVRVVSGATGATIREVLGDDPSADFGAAVAFVGDVDGDGLDDVAIGAALDDDGPGNDAGRVRLVSSGTGAFVFDVLGGQAFGRFGASVDAGGDQDGDGVPDVLVGEPRHDGVSPDTGRALVLSGVDGAPLLSMAGDVASGWIGTHVARIGDVDGDGVDEYALTARTAGVPDADAGHVELRDGATGDVVFALDGSGPFDGIVDVVSGGGDVDNDGVPDVAIGTTAAGFVGAPDGAVIVVNPSPQQTPWKNLGALLPGGTHAPELTGSGSLTGGDALALSLVDALPLMSTTFVIGVTSLSAPFKGGVLVPQPTLLLPGLVTDGDGAVTLGGPWPVGVPSGLALYAQVWIPDVEAPNGFAASNAVVGTTP